MVKRFLAYAIPPTNMTRRARPSCTTLRAWQKLRSGTLRGHESFHGLCRNRYYVMRHGESLANVHGIISSDPAVAIENHGLSAEGRRQASDAANAFVEQLRSDTNYRIALFSSDFKRAVETAAALMQRLGREPQVHVHSGRVQTSIALRERNFGDLNGHSTLHYENVWVQDKLDASHCKFGVESVESVLARSAAFVADVEQQLAEVDVACTNTRIEGSATLNPWHVVIVAHGDVLQILQTGFQGVDPSTHRSLPHLDTAVCRELLLQPIQQQ